MIMAGLPSTTLDDRAAAHLASGGRSLLLLGANLASAPQVRRLTAAASCAANAPTLIAADHEPGRIARLERVGVPPIPAGVPAAILAKDAAEAAQAMRAIGVNFTLAPVLDVPAASSPRLRGRTLGRTAGPVATSGVAFLTATQSLRVATAAKHFPGLGRATSDTHYTTATVHATSDDLERVDLAPFRVAIAAGVKAVMVGHAVYPAIDAEKPASLSPAVMSLLREGLGFRGVIITDALGMAAARRAGPIEDITVAALRAGADLLIVEDPGSVDRAVGAIVAAVERGDLTRSRLAEAAGRVRQLAAWASPVQCRPATPKAR